MKHKVNYVAFVLDESGSMAHLEATVEKQLQDLLEALRKNSSTHGQTTYVSVYGFDTSVRMIASKTRVSEKIAYTFHRWGGQTALFDAVGKAIFDLEHIAPRHDEDVSFLLITLTDGHENASFNYNAKTFKNKMEEIDRLDNWTLTFQLPPGHAQSFCKNYGIPEGNCREWEATTKGLVETSHATEQSIATYTMSRSLGQTKMSSFYKATTDLSNVSKKDLKDLDNLTSRFSFHTVDKEQDIQSFVEQKTGKPYLKGLAFYQLSKPETIQGNKDILLVEKGKKTVYGGQNARDLVGLQQYKDGKVTPGNHSNYDIFVQSMSNNRKLVRGTKVLVVK